MARGLGANGEFVRTVEDFRTALARAYRLARDEKVSSLRAQLERSELVILYDLDSEHWDLLPREEAAAALQAPVVKPLRNRFAIYSAASLIIALTMAAATGLPPFRPRLVI